MNAIVKVDAAKSGSFQWPHLQLNGVDFIDVCKSVTLSVDADHGMIWHCTVETSSTIIDAPPDGVEIDLANLTIVIGGQNFKLTEVKK